MKEPKSEFVGYIPLISGKKAEMWLETGWNEKNFAFIIRLKLIDPNTGQPIGMPEQKDGVEDLNIGRRSTKKTISSEIRKIIEKEKE